MKLYRRPCPWAPGVANPPSCGLLGGQIRSLLAINPFVGCNPMGVDGGPCCPLSADPLYYLFDDIHPRAVLWPDNGADRCLVVSEDVDVFVSISLTHVCLYHLQCYLDALQFCCVQYTVDVVSGPMYALFFSCFAGQTVAAPVWPSMLLPSMYTADPGVVLVRDDVVVL